MSLVSVYEGLERFLSSSRKVPAKIPEQDLEPLILCGKPHDGCGHECTGLLGESDHLPCLEKSCR